MIGVYFSGTGNTKYCVEVFLDKYQGKGVVYAIENKEAIEAISKADSIVFAYPVYYSNLPKIVKDFIIDNKSIWAGKEIFVIASMGLFSGDGAGRSAHLLKQYGATIIGGLHLKMPDCIADEKVLKKTIIRNKEIVKQAVTKIEDAALQVQKHTPPKEGLGFFCQMIGLFGQRLWFYNKTAKYSNKLLIDKEKCIGCNSCVVLCPMGNIVINNNKALSKAKCTMCYRCINHCPKQAITLLGKKIVEQSSIEKYL